MGTDAQARRTMVTLRGDMDNSTAGHHREVLSSAIASGYPLVLDTTPVDFLGTAGVQALLEVHRECRARGLPWALIATDGTREMLSRIGEARALPVVASTAEALALTQAADDEAPLMPVVDRTKTLC
ncbi:STAS domain-containing protein [Mycobacterium sp. PS03-16]|uniref:STAS domain-containing protein n=1 Tax=Mycobacterium sp. PS03-16 TaxID=2559611 RepID=UPI001FD7C95E|nr:STAS domain-containing protein [Mycobacterium sp. PS03-16]